MIRNTFALFMVLMLMTACSGAESESTAGEADGSPTVSAGEAEKAAGQLETSGSLATAAATPPVSTPTRSMASNSAEQPAIAAPADEDPMEEQRCVWRCLADSNGNTDPAYERCVAAQCGGGESKAEDDSAAAR